MHRKHGANKHTCTHAHTHTKQCDRTATFVLLTGFAVFSASLAFDPDAAAADCAAASRRAFFACTHGEETAQRGRHECIGNMGQTNTHAHTHARNSTNLPPALCF
jgi:hypothetical protein